MLHTFEQKIKINKKKRVLFSLVFCEISFLFLFYDFNKLRPHTNLKLSLKYKYAKKETTNPV